MFDREELKRNFDIGLTSKNGSAFRNALLEQLGWKVGDPRSPYDLFVAAVQQGQPIPPQHGPSQSQPSRWAISYRQVVRDVIQNKMEYGTAAQKVLDSGWDFTDSQFNKPADQIEDFLRQCANEVGHYHDMAESRRRLFKMILDGWLRWASASVEA